MKLLLKARHGKEFESEYDILLKNVKCFEESYSDKKIYVKFANNNNIEIYSMIQYMAWPLD